MKRIAAVLGSLLFLVVLAACGGGGGGEGLPAVPPTAELQQLLRGLKLTGEDLPSGFFLDSEEFATNDEAAQQQELDPPAEALARFDRNRRVLGYDAEYSSEPSLQKLLAGEGQVIFIAVGFTYYEDQGGAADAFRYGKERLPDLKETLAQNLADEQGFSNVKVTSFAVRKFGDDRLAFRITADAPADGQTIPAAFEFVAFRRGNIIASVLMGALNTTSVEETDELVRKLEAKIQAGLRK